MKWRPNFFALTGMPRSGTTYLTAVLYNPPRVVTVSELKGRWKQLYRGTGSDVDILPVFEEIRGKILRGEPINSFAGTPGFLGEQGVDTWNQPKKEIVIPVEEGFAVGMKNPEVFLSWLDNFREAGIRCVITVRHPLSVLHSWCRRAKSVAGGGNLLRRLKTRSLGETEAGKSVQRVSFADGRCTTYQSSQIDSLARRIDLHNHFAGQIVMAMGNEHVMIVRHEDWFSQPNQLSRVAGFLEIPHLDHLRPPPMAPKPIVMPRDMQAQILRKCTIAEDFGYPISHGALLPPEFA